MLLSLVDVLHNGMHPARPHPTMKRSVLGFLALVALAPAWCLGAISYVPVTGDADSGISALNTYTHTLDFGQGTPGALINGVQFDAYNVGADGTLGFNRTVSSGSENDNPGNGNHNVTGGLATLLTDMIFNGNNEAGGTTTWTLSGLTSGITYDTRIYTRQWGPGTRNVDINFDPDGAGGISDSTGIINQDDASLTPPGFDNPNDAYYINYRFTAVDGQDLVITATQSDFNQSWHLYGLTNQVVPEPSQAVLCLLGTAGILLRRRR